MNSSFVCGMSRSSSLLKRRMRERYSSALRSSSFRTWSARSAFTAFSSFMISELIALPMAFAMADHGLILMGAISTRVSSASSRPPPAE